MRASLGVVQVWKADITRLRDAALDVKQLSLFRSPRVYRDFTKWVVLLALLYDTFYLATVLGGLYRSGYAWAWLLTVLVSLIEAVLVSFTVVVVEACREMEYPFGNDTLDMPALSYCTSAALQSLVLVAPSSAPWVSDPHTADAAAAGPSAAEKLQTTDLVAIMGEVDLRSFGVAGSGGARPDSVVNSGYSRVEGDGDNDDDRKADDEDDDGGDDIDA